ncbi:hypothetical protein [Exiguobacterium acetylicum]|uniref:hypothetical protein n=1 Tax=Exiguobacterium acetylicum TaxID=41170 RepID=UPI001CA692E2|nr:hypothetical protein [Exiguobacterium acetylicum]QZY88657.1 hypothetical protein K7G97_17260 [Exiguobacterium acetylicum]
MEWFLIIVLFVVIYLFIRVVFQPSSSIAELMIENQKSHKTQVFDSRKRYSKFNLSPKKLREEAQHYEWDLTPTKWLMISMVSVITISLFFYLSFGKNELMLPLGIVGVIVPRIMVNQKRRKYRVILLDRLLVFLNAFTSTLLVTHQTVKALKEIKSLQHYTIQDDIEKIIVSISSGVGIQKSFEDFIGKYPFKMLKFYVDQLDIADRDGGSDTYKILADVVKDIESEKTLAAELKTNLVREKRAYYQNAAFVLLVPLLFNFMPKMADALTETIEGKVVIAFNFLAVLGIYFIVRKLSNFNPMAEK